MDTRKLVTFGLVSWMLLSIYGAILGSFEHTKAVTFEQQLQRERLVKAGYDVALSISQYFYEDGYAPADLDIDQLRTTIPSDKQAHNMFIESTCPSDARTGQGDALGYPRIATTAIVTVS